MSEVLLQARDLSLSYGNYQAIKPVDFSLNAGDLIALVGPNGSGKTTLLSCLSGLLRPTTGEITIEGFDLYQDERQVRQRLVFVPDVPTFYQELTAWEHLYVIAMANGLKDGFESRAQELMSEFGLWEARHLFPHAYSRGMRLKLAIVLALIRPFSVILLDEPSSALDAESTEKLCEKLLGLASTKTAILLSTHDPYLSTHLNAKTWSLHDGILSIA